MGDETIKREGKREKWGREWKEEVKGGRLRVKAISERTMRGKDREVWQSRR